MDEKTLLPHVALPPASGPAGTPRLSSFVRRTWLAGASTIALLLFLLSPLQHHLGPCRSHQHELKGIKRSPNATLEWVPCADSPALFCSSLVVPLNWLEPLKNETAEIFLKMYPAANEKRIGSMLINPGGPGGSGNYFAERAGASLSFLTGGVYDIVVRSSPLPLSKTTSQPLTRLLSCSGIRSERRQHDCSLHWRC